MTDSEVQKERPVVGKFAQNIYSDQYFTESVYYDYISAFWQGYNMQTYFYAQECLDYGSTFMDAFHEWYLTATYARGPAELSDLFFSIAGTSFNDGWYYCYLYQDDFIDDYSNKFSDYNDFGEIYLSLIFNLLQNSLNIKTQSENMIAAYDIHDTVTFSRALGNILRSIFDFESYTSLQGSLDGSESTKKKRAPKFERQAILEENLKKGEERMHKLAQEHGLNDSQT